MQKSEVINYDLRNSVYEPKGMFSCGQQSINQQIENGSYNPYEPYNTQVFDSNEDNIIDDAEYVYDYLSQMIGIS